MTTDPFWDDVDRHLVRYIPAFTPRIIERAAGSYVYDSDGNAILDFTSGQMSAVLGHSHPDIVKTVTDSIASLAHLFSGMLCRPVVTLATRLADTLPDALSKVLLLTTGAESNEAAHQDGQDRTPGSTRSSSFDRSWHGMTSGAPRRLSRRPPRLRPGAARQPHPADAQRLPLAVPERRRLLRLASRSWTTGSRGRRPVDRIPGRVPRRAHPVLGRHHRTPARLPRTRSRRCARARGMLLIVDEAQTGLGRTGTMYAFERDGVAPDILTLSKTLGAGLPVAAVMTSDDIERVCAERGFLFYTTHVSDPLAAAVALHRARVIERDGLVERAAKLGDRLRDRLRRPAGPVRRGRRRPRTRAAAGHRTGHRSGDQEAGRPARAAPSPRPAWSAACT